MCFESNFALHFVGPICPLLLHKYTHRSTRFLGFPTVYDMPMLPLLLLLYFPPPPLILILNFPRKWRDVRRRFWSWRFTLISILTPLSPSSLVTGLLWRPGNGRCMMYVLSSAKTQNVVPHTDSPFQKTNPRSRISLCFPIFPCNFWCNSCQNQGRDVDQTNPQKCLVKFIVWLVMNMSFLGYLLFFAHAADSLISTQVILPVKSGFANVEDGMSGRNPIDVF